MKLKFIVFIISLFCFCSSSIYGQDTKGTDFWLTFGLNSGLSTPSANLQIRIAGGDLATTGTIYFTQLGTSVPFSIAANQVFTYIIPPGQKPAVYNAVAGKNKLSVRVTSSEPVAVYALNQQSATTDATNVLPARTLGTEYYQISYAPVPNRVDAYAVIATEDSTEVFHNSISLGVLDAGEVYFQTSTTDMTGAHVTSDKPVAFFAMNGGTNIPLGSGAADILYQQLPPVNTWGKNVFVPVSHLEQDIVRIMVAQNGTTITQTGGTILSPAPAGGQTTLSNLNAGQWVELIVPLSSNGCYIQADKPIGVCAYLTGFEYHPANKMSDPAEAWVPPVEQGVSSALITPFIPTGGTNLNAHYALIITPTDVKNSIRFKTGTGAMQNLYGGVWYDNVAAGMSFYRMPLPYMISHLFTNTAGEFTIMCYGTGSAESYYFLASSGMRSLDAGFYVNDTHYQELASETFCSQPALQFRAKIDGDVSTSPGHLKWYIDGVEETDFQDQYTWSKSLDPGRYEVSIVTLMDDDITTKTVTGTVVVVSCLRGVNDYAVTPVNKPISISIQDNDEMGSCNADDVVTTLLDDPVSGTAMVDSVGRILYTPNPEFLGIDSLQYVHLCTENTGPPEPAWVYLFVYPNEIQLCPGATTDISLDFELDGATVQWYNNNNPIDTISIVDAEAMIYPYEARVTFPAILDLVEVRDTLSGYEVNIFPTLMYWNNVATNSNWNDPGNWVDSLGIALDAVPKSCTDVHIPGNAVYFPSLDTIHTIRDEEYGEPECHNIYFHYGGELAKPHLLTYNKAYVQYNFGYFDSTAYKTDGDPYSTTPMRRGRWYALATPLKKITPGDFSFGGFPSAWQQGFVRRKTDMGTFSGEWRMPHNANATNIGVSQSHGISIWMADIAPGVIGEDEEYQANLNGLKGVVQLPFFEEEDTIGGPHRIHTYDGTSSRFYYYWNLDPQQTIEMTMYDQITRGDEGYRFVFDNELTTEIIDSKPLPVFTMDVPAGEEVMIGNPFVSNLDFDKFFELNRSNLKNGTYRMYVDNTWVDYTYGIGSGTLTPYIAPLQAFFIETAGSDTIQLLFPPDSLSVTNPLNKLRAGNVRDSGNFYDDVVYVEAENDEGESWVTLVLAKNDNLVVENVQRLFNYNERYAGVPQIYSLYNGQKNSVQLLDEESEIPVGIHSNSKKSMTLRFHNLDRQHVSSLKLYDQVENVTYDLLDGDSEIRFLNTPDISERFILRVGNQTSGIGETIQDEKETEVRIFMEGNRLNVRSNEGIDKVAVISVQGLKITDISMAGSAYNLSTELETTPGVYIVRVLLINGKTKTQKLTLMPL